ncbi:MAG: MFS transporter [archaeon]|nr:MFS transporter [archaeon]
MGTNCSSGILSASSKGIKKQMNLTDASFGQFGYWNSNGRLLGSFAFLLFLYRLSRKYLLGIGLLIKGFFLIMFKFTDKFELLLFFRFMTGITHMIPSIYIPTWLDQFGLSTQRPNLITIYNAFSTIGKVTGYGLVHLFSEEEVRKNKFNLI